MTDPSLVRVLQAQTRRRVGLIDYTVVAQGPEAIRARIARLRADGVGIAIVDALSNDDLLRLGPALADLPLLTAGSGVAIALPANFGLSPNPRASALPAPQGFRAVISGSCSRATNGQVAQFLSQGLPAFALDPISLCDGDEAIERALEWARPKLGATPLLVYSTAAPDGLRQVQEQLGVAHAGELVERALARIACGQSPRSRAAYCMSRSSQATSAHPISSARPSTG